MFRCEASHAFSYNFHGNTNTVRMDATIQSCALIIGLREEFYKSCGLIIELSLFVRSSGAESALS